MACWILTLFAALELRPAPPDPPPVDGCTVTVVGLPVPARAHHELEVSGGRTRLTGDGLQLRLEHLAIVVRLVGPRYAGELTLHPRSCTGGTTHVLSAKPRRATILFAGPKELAMRCDGGPEILAERWWIARKLPPVDVGHGATVTCEFKSPGYHPLRRRVTLAPGDNTLAVEMDALPSQD